MKWNGQTIRDLERNSIRAFVQRHREYLVGRVLDFGCGTQPYRDLVRGEYVAYDAGLKGYEQVGSYPEIIDERFDAILCTQSIQYNPDPKRFFDELAIQLKIGGHLVLTGPTNWAEVEDIDLVRLTLAGVKALMSPRLSVITLERRAEIDLDGFKLSLGYGLVARRV